MGTTTVPAARFGWPGQTLEYTVKTEGASELTAPKECADGLKVRVLQTRQVQGGTEAKVAVDVVKPVLF